MNSYHPASKVMKLSFLLLNDFTEMNPVIGISPGEGITSHG